MSKSKKTDMGRSVLSFAIRVEYRDDFEVRLFRTRKVRKRIEYIDILVDGEYLLSMMKLSAADLTTMANSGFTYSTQVAALRQQLAKGLSDPELPSGIVPVYICSVCGDYGCGVFGWKIRFGDDTVTWSDFGWDDNLNQVIDEDDEPDPQYISKAIIFDRAQYFEALENIPAFNRHDLGK